MFVAAAVAILVALALAITRAIKGPTVFDRVLAGNSVGVLAILLLAVVGFLTGRPAFLDIALTYGLLNLIGTLAVLIFGMMLQAGISLTALKLLILFTLFFFTGPVVTHALAQTCLHEKIRPL